MVPVAVSKTIPEGRLGDMEYESTVPAYDVGVTEVMAVPTDSWNEFVAYTITGNASLTEMVIVAVSLPAEFVAVTV